MRLGSFSRLQLPAACSSAALTSPPLACLPPPPPADARRDLILRQLGPGGPISAQLSESDLDKVVARTEGYSG